MANRRDLKSYVRYDGSGRVIPGSNVLRKNKPKVGKWKEIQTYECCNPSPTIQALRLTFDSIENADLLVGDSSDVNDWNTFFDLPNYGNPFTSVEVVDDEVRLFGGSDIETKFGLFSDYPHILEVWDYAGYIIVLGDETFGGTNYLSNLQSVYFPEVVEIIGDSSNYGALGTCYDLTYAYLPKCTILGACAFYESTQINENNLILPYSGITILNDYTFSYTAFSTISMFENVTTVGDGCFQDCTSLTTVDLPQLTTAGYGCFAYCTSLTTIDLPQLITAVIYCFDTCTSLTTINIPQLTTAEAYSFNYCTSLTTIDLPQLITAGYGCFQDCTSLTTIDLPSLISAGSFFFANSTSLTTINIPLCTDLGGSVGDNNVFNSIVGNTITATFNSVLSTCNSGSPDGDIQYLEANNTVTITYV